MNPRSLLILLIIVAIVSCKNQSCPSFDDLGDLYWSSDTQNWIPPEYLDEPLSLKYVSSDNQEKIFTLDTSYVLKNSAWTIEVNCENGEGITRYRYRTWRHIGRFSSSDSLYITFGMGIWNELLSPLDQTEIDFYEWVYMSITNYSMLKIDSEVGLVRIVTDLRNSELEDMDHTPNRYIFHETLLFQGRLFNNVYTSLNTEDSPADIVFRKGDGIIAFIDEDNTLWTLD